MLARALLFSSCLLLLGVGAACSSGENAGGLAYGGAGGATSDPPDTGVSGSAGSGPAGAGGVGVGGVGGVGGSGGSVQDAGRPYDPDAGFDWPEAVDAGKCQAGTYSGTYDCTVDYGGILFPITGKVSFELTPSVSGEFLEIKDGKLAADVVEFQVTMTGDLVGKLECLTNQFAATIQNGSYTFSFLGLPLPNPFNGDLSGALDRLTSTMTGQWNLASQAPLGVAAPTCSGQWRVTRQP